MGSVVRLPKGEVESINKKYPADPIFILNKPYIKFHHRNALGISLSHYLLPVDELEF
jgi:hypothetical protein